MVSEKLARTLLSKTDLTNEDISKMTEAEGWAIIYSQKKVSEQNQQLEICFTGFSKSDRERLSNVATQSGFIVKEGVTKNLQILVTGDNAGESKISRAKSQECVITDEQGFLDFIESQKTSV